MCLGQSWELHPGQGQGRCSVAVLPLPALLKIAEMLKKNKLCWVCFSFPFQSMLQGITQVTSTIPKQKSYLSCSLWLRWFLVQTEQTGLSSGWRITLCYGWTAKLKTRIFLLLPCCVRRNPLTPGRCIPAFPSPGHTPGTSLLHFFIFTHTQTQFVTFIGDKHICSRTNIKWTVLLLVTL